MAATALAFVVLAAASGASVSGAGAGAARVGDLAEAARRCAAQEKLLNAADGRCYHPASDGPCNQDRDEFFVLDTSMSGWFGRCMARPCRGGRVKWTDGQCYDGVADRDRLCPTPGHIVGLDAYGVGECVCNFLHARPINGSGSSNRCYQLYTRGPCPDKAVLVAKPNGKRWQGVCAWDPCHQYQTEGEAVWLYWDRDGKCHQTLNDNVCACGPNGLAPSGECGPDYRFAVDWNTLKPNCVTNNLLNLTPDARCTGCQTTKTEHFDRRILYQGGGS